MEINSSSESQNSLMEFQDKFQERLQTQSIQDKIKLIALHELYLKKQELDKQLDHDIKLLHQKFDTLCKPIYEKINQIVNGEYDLKVEDLGQSLHYLNEQEIQNIEQDILLQKGARLENYWLNVFQNCQILQDEIKPHDVPILQFLKYVQFERKIISGYDSQILVFDFYQNEFFENKRLSKQFLMQNEDNCNQTFGTVIKWYKGQDVTKMIINEKVKLPNGFKKYIQKTINQDSFFNLFQSQDIRKNKIKDTDDVDQLKEQIEKDVELALIIYEEAIQYSIQYYFGLKKTILEQMYDDDDWIYQE